MEAGDGIERVGEVEETDLEYRSVPKFEITDQIKKLSSRHLRMIERLVLDGMTVREVAKEFKVNADRLLRLRKSPIWAEEERRLRKEHLEHYHGRLSILIPKAIGALEEAVAGYHIRMVEGKEEVVHNDMKDRINAAKEILSRSGLVSGMRIEGELAQDVILSPEVRDLLAAWGANLDNVGKVEVMSRTVKTVSLTAKSGDDGGNGHKVIDITPNPQGMVVDREEDGEME